MSKTLEIKIHINSDAEKPELFGPGDQNLRLLRSAMGVRIAARNGNIIISGDAAHVRETAEILDKMQNKLSRRSVLAPEDVQEMIIQSQNAVHFSTGSGLVVYSHKGIIEPFTPGQQQYIKMMHACDLTFCIGPAGTGKTYVAVAMAVSMLKKKEVRKIVLARPAVEAGERLGFLPGDLQAKVNPYLRPLFDSLEDMMDFAQVRKFMEMDIIEVIPLAFMRGRTFNEAVVICDEAQNTLPSQMLMLLTRLGRGSKMIITGDITQTDLEKGQICGLIDAIETLKDIAGIGFVELAECDIVRHRLVQNIVGAYDRRKKTLQQD